MSYIKIFDTTLRDGEQTPGVTLNTAEKIEIAKQLARLGVDIIEAGFPITSTGDFEAVSKISLEVEGPVICGLARTNRADIERAAEALEPAAKSRIHVFTSGSKIHLEHMLRKTPDEVVQASIESVRLAREFTDDVEFSAQDCTRSELDFLYRLYGAAIGAGATTINIPDTVGYGMPQEYAELIRNIREHVPGAGDVAISTHCHDDLGLAVANSLAAVGAGARQVECTLNGIGERAGNTSLEEVVMALHTRRDLWGHETGIRTRELYRTSRMVSMYTGVMVPPNKAVIGENAFAHEAGIHQDGVIKALETYEIMSAETVGRDAGVLVMGKHSGRRAFRKTLSDMGFELEDERVNALFKQFKDLCDRKQKVTSETSAPHRRRDGPRAGDLRAFERAVSVGHGHDPGGDRAAPHRHRHLRGGRDRRRPGRRGVPGLGAHRRVALNLGELRASGRRQRQGRARRGQHPGLAHHPA
jgi:2-isopropylmalate synthase